MNQKTAKLLSRYAEATGRDLEALKKWFDSLNPAQRGEATKLMKAQMEGKQP